MNVTGLELDRIGQIGENFFRGLCLQCGLNCSRLEPDRTGKDFIVEFDLEGPAQQATSYDKRPPPIQVTVQIKTVLNTNTAARIALSVGERLAKDVHPTIICILKIDRSGKIVGAHFVHVLGSNLGRILKRLRRSSKKGDAELHSQEITFKATAANAVSIDPSSFRAALSTLVGQGMLEYAEEKKRQLTELGYDQYRYAGQFSIGALPADDLIDGFLGLRELPITDVSVFERRFEIDLLQEKFSDAIIQIDLGTQHPSRVVMTSKLTKEYVSLTGSALVVPPALTGAPSYAASFATAVGKFSLRPGKWTFHQSPAFHPDSSHPIEDWEEFILCGKILSLGAIAIELHMEGIAAPLSIVTDNEQSGHAHDLDGYLGTIRRLRAIRQLAGVTQPLVSLQAIWSKRRQIEALGQLCSTENLSIDLKGELDDFPILKNERGAYFAAVHTGAEWIGLYLPVEISTTDENGRRIKGQQSGELLLEQLPGDDVALAFSNFLTRIKKISGVRTIIHQAPNEFLTEAPARVEHTGEDIDE